MGKTLRLGFAMGGGVSLGTFSGSALSEVLKLVILRGQDREGNAFDNVVVDVFSGASAGAMSLAIMLRSLVSRTPGQVAKATQALDRDFGNEFTSLDPGKRQMMIAAQVLQDVQEEIWVEKICLERLLEPEAAGLRLRTTAAVLNRGAVDELAAEYISFPHGIRLADKQLLGDRVLFGATISNMTPILADARKDLNADEIGFLGLADGMTSNLHREIRVFDLIFSNIQETHLHDVRRFPSRWCRYHVGPAIHRDPHGIGSITEPKVWAKIAATSVASGAFPGAFEPVVLERRSYEYGPALWPFGENQDRHNFTFVDGGVFNNEPIREAFRLASFIDAQNPSDKYERCIVFVDPNVANPATKGRVSVHRRFKIYDPNFFGTFDGYDLEELHSLDRLLPQIMTLIGAVTDEAGVIEADKVYQTRKRFKLRNGIRSQLAGGLSIHPDGNVLADLATYCTKQLDRNRDYMMIPVGALTLTGEIARVIQEEADASLDGLKDKRLDEIEAFAVNPSAAVPGEAGLWLRALAFVAVDLIMDLEGKQERNRLIAIAPVLDPKDPKSIVDLPGGKLAAFGGFTSEIPGRYEVKLARYCAKTFLETSGSFPALIRPGGTGEPKPVFTAEEEEQYLSELRKGVGDLRGRIIDLIADSHVPILGAIPKPVLELFLRSKFDALVDGGLKSTRYEFRIQVTDKRFELDGKGLADKDIAPVAIGDKLYLVTFADYTPGKPATKRWSGVHLKSDSQAIEVFKDAFLVLPDRRFCTIRLPTEQKLAKADTMGYPVFTAVLKSDDEGKPLSSNRWKLADETVGLETRILALPKENA